jgi:hypothetical protein
MYDNSFRIYIYINVPVGDIVASIEVFEFPPRESFNNHVSTEFLYGTNPLSVVEDSTFITSPKLDSDLLMLLASTNLSP